MLLRRRVVVQRRQNCCCFCCFDASVVVALSLVVDGAVHLDRDLFFLSIVVVVLSFFRRSLGHEEEAERALAHFERR